VQSAWERFGGRGLHPSLFCVCVPARLVHFPFILSCISFSYIASMRWLYPSENKRKKSRRSQLAIPDEGPPSRPRPSLVSLLPRLVHSGYSSWNADLEGERDSMLRECHSREKEKKTEEKELCSKPTFPLKMFRSF
jgi:hypothetical protein